jgi:non-homologous end joining protein Ku
MVKSTKSMTDSTAVEVKEPATKDDINNILDALKALTTAVADLTAEWGKWRKAGKF